MFIALVLTALISACSEETSRERNMGGASKQEESPSSLPSFKSDLNVLQNGQNQSSSIFSLSETSQEGVLFWGKQIDFYIRNSARGEVHCLITRFPSPAQKEYLIMAARPIVGRDTIETQKYYYQLSPHDQESNKRFCHTLTLLNNLKISSDDTTFSLDKVCPDCTASSLTSQPLLLTNVYGQKVQSVETHYINIQILFTDFSHPSHASCTSSSTCRSKGFDCCSAGQCVRDGQHRQGIDQQNSDFLQAEKDILENPHKISDYPQFYHLCTQQISAPTTPSPTKQNTDTAARRLAELQELYQCTTPFEGEKGLCTWTVENAQGSGTYTLPGDDRDFSFTYTNSKTPLLKRTIDGIIHAGKTLYDEHQTTLVPNTFQFGPSNDSLIDGQNITLSHPPPPKTPSTLKIRYQIDASCEPLGYNLARCYKIYVQGQNKARIDDHYPASNDFLLPFYADTKKNIQVEVDDIPKLFGTHWRLEESPTPKIVFTPDRSNLFVKDNQTVKIIFFVDLNQYPVMTSKKTALQTIQAICQCTDTRCRLEPKQKNETIVDYLCQYPPPLAPEPPLQQSISLSTKTVPHRYFDAQGSYIKKIEPQTQHQEGIAFEYQNNDFLKPNNVNKPVGFNEIYGSLGSSINHAFPAQEIAIKKGKNYNIYVDSGHFSSCLKCGHDYYSQLKKLFPTNFLHQGGGYYPDFVTTDRFSNKTPYRSDDLLFGRACWIPATMIPWTHTPLQDTQKQRLRRLSAQHFLFANGYQRDWYGFDYGAIIGSFDGVAWFAIGNKRQIHAKGNKLFLAVNAYFGDITRPNNFRVTVSESRGIYGSDVSVKNSFQSDGAECRKYHLCESDRDCANQLGWEYSCETITGMSSDWPLFDSNSLEMPDTSRQQNLLRLFDARGGKSKRCVYRGRGALCHPNYQVPGRDLSYSGTTLLGMHACSYNTHCQAFSEGTMEKKFNTRISRYPLPPDTLNNSSEVDFSDLNTFGLDAKLIGRPERWIGREEVPGEIFSALHQNNVQALCLPGRNPTDSTLSVQQHHSSEPDINSLGDKVLNIGVTPTGSAGQDHYLNACSIYDESGNYYQEDANNLSETLDNGNLARLAGSQAIPTNSLEQLEGLIEEELITNFEQIQVQTPILQENRCLRAPGSACFSNLDCAPSLFISKRTQAIDHEDNSLWTTLNPYEIRFWQEDLICSQSAPPESEDYNLKNNRCCRETGKTLTIGTLVDQSHHAVADTNIPVFDNQSIPGLGATTAGIDLNDPLRYTRNTTIFDLSGTPSYPPLQSARKDACNQPGGCFTPTDFDWNNQFNSFATTAERTCCSGHWIRNFHPENGGGHSWQASKTQTISKESFTCLNWLQCNATAGNCSSTPFTCDHTEQPDDPLCLAKSTSLLEARPFFQFLGTLELLGIPQIKIKAAGVGFSNWPEVDCQVAPNNQETSGDGIPLPDIINPAAVPEYQSLPFQNLLAADDPDNFSENIKQIFSADEISCCLPAGTRVEEGTSPDRCCTGFINPEKQRCQLRDFTNVSIYFNRYVSSHAKDIYPTLFDQETGYINSPVHVETLACQTNVCASNVIARGVALSELNIPGHETSNIKIRRWLDNNAPNNNGLEQLYNSGQRWNEHVYCVPPDSNIPTTIQCGD